MLLARIAIPGPRSAPLIRWSFPAHQRTVARMEGLFFADKPDPNKKLREVPHKPGVYLMKDRLRRVIYVGKARDLRKRLAQYFMPSRRMTADLKTRALLDALAEGEFDAAIGGARRDEEKSRAKERVYSFRDPYGQWDPKNQRPELWNLFNSRLNSGESIRVSLLY